MTRLFLAAAAIALTLVAIGAGRLAAERDASAVLAPDAGLSPLPAKLTLDDAVAAVRRSSLEQVGRVDRLAAKLLTYQEYLDVAGPIRSPGGGLTGWVGDPAKRALWVVAVSGQVYPNGRVPVWFGGPPPVPSPTPYPPYASGLFIVDAVFGGAGLAMADEHAAWPAAFDRLPNHPRAAYVEPSPTPMLPPIAVRRHGAAAMSLVLREVLEARIERIQYKLVTWDELERVAGTVARSGRAGSDPAWIVAVSGDFSALKKAPAPLSRWYLYAIDPNSDDEARSVLAVWGGAGSWPAYFDALPDHPAAQLSAVATPTRSPRFGRAIGALRLKMTAAEVRGALGSPNTETIAHGIGTAEWVFAAGVTVDLRGAASDPTTVWKIVVRAPFAGRTDGGIGIGSSRDDVRRAYASIGFTEPREQLFVADDDSHLGFLFDASGRVTMIVLDEGP